uniref:Uncharacterized protein n=1 Tax=Rhizophora mucronata TaxID=61149 RepID=A0A2P2N314_RHIMU
MLFQNLILGVPFRSYLTFMRPSTRINLFLQCIKQGWPLNNKHCAQ